MTASSFGLCVMVQMIRYVTSEETFDSDLIDAIVFLRRRFVREAETAAATKRLADVLKSEWASGITVTAWVSRAVEQINRSTAPSEAHRNQGATERHDEPQTATMNAAEYLVAAALLGLTDDVAGRFLGVEPATIDQWKRAGGVPAAEAKLLRMTVHLGFTPLQVIELTREPIGSSHEISPS